MSKAGEGNQTVQTYRRLNINRSIDSQINQNKFDKGMGKIDAIDVKSAYASKIPELMSDTEMEKLEKLLNCKDRAVNKWIQEKEQHFDQMTQKLYTKSKKLISKNLKHQG
jgi:succinate dehydrogenase flavin-adding protein (antitoxin of CptAB toxin-antitoxin module)